MLIFTFCVLDEYSMNEIIRNKHDVSQVKFMGGHKTVGKMSSVKNIPRSRTHLSDEIRFANMH
jgi:hypothetical protein